MQKLSGIIQSLSGYLFLFFNGFLLNRFLEFTFAVQTTGLRETLWVSYIWGAFYDVFLASTLGLALVLLSIAFFYINFYVGLAVSLLLMSSVILVSSLLTGYFLHSLTPLGAELFSYSLDSVLITMGTSTTSFTTLWLLLTPTVLFIIGALIIFFLEWQPKFLTPPIALTVGIVGLLGMTVLHPYTNEFPTRTNYYAYSNKLVYFSERILISSSRNQRLRELVNKRAAKVRQKEEGLSGKKYYPGDTRPWSIQSEYPLYRRSRHNNVLGEYLQSTQEPPNIVMIVVCGFGGSFIEPHARFGKFTPHLDSLAKKSLYWPNGLSTSGRSFGVWPSLLGSLPHGKNGFISMGYRMPDHNSLVKTLNKNNYHTGFYLGSNASFDKMDIFFERQQADFIMDQSDFSDKYTRMKPTKDGFSWGFSDRDTFRQAMGYINSVDSDRPRLDLYFPLNFHDPWYIPNRQEYMDRLQEIINEESDPQRKQLYRDHSNIFSALLYVDDVVHEAIQRYRRRDDFSNTIFMITGDHRIAKIPHRNFISRYNVPFLIYSPLLKESRQFDSVVSHLEVTPTLLSYLESEHSIETPDKVHWLGSTLDTSPQFRSTGRVPFMQTKNRVSDYLSGQFYLSKGKHYKLQNGMYLKPLNNSEKLAELKDEFLQFQVLNRYVTTRDKLTPASPGKRPERQRKKRLLQEEQAILEKHNLRGSPFLNKFRKAQKLAWNEEREEALILLRRLIRENPNNPDALLLKGRILAWKGKYDQAEDVLLNVEKNHRGYPDVYRAVGDLYYWSGNPKKGVDILKRGLEYNKSHPDLLYRLARAYRGLGQMQSARETYDRAYEQDPDHKLASKLSDLR